MASITKGKTGVVTTAMLSEDEVNNRLDLCKDPVIIAELYDFGIGLAKDSLDQVKSIETKATSFAAYGSGIIAFLVSTVSIWSKTGNQWSMWVALCAGISGLMCTISCVRALKLSKYETISQDEWLKTECLTQSIEELKKFRVLTLWAVIDSRLKAQFNKAGKLRAGEIWLTASVGYLVFLLFQLAIIHTGHNMNGIALRQCMIHHNLCVSSWTIFPTDTLVGGFCAICLVFSLGFVYWRTRLN